MTQKFLYVYRADGLNHHLAIIQHTSHLYTVYYVSFVILFIVAFSDYVKQTLLWKTCKGCFIPFQIPYDVNIQDGCLNC
jgi:hypothetical protein